MKKILTIIQTKQFIIFFITGFSAFLIDFFLLHFFVYIVKFDTIVFNVFSLPNIISALVATVSNFFMQKILTFDAKGTKNVKKEALKFLAVYVFNITVFSGIIFGIFLNSGINISISKIITTILQMFSSFMLYKYFVFVKENNVI